MKKFFAKNKKQSPCLISPKDFKKYRKLLLTGVAVMRGRHAARQADRCFRKSLCNHQKSQSRLQIKRPGIFPASFLSNAVLRIIKCVLHIFKPLIFL